MGNAARSRPTRWTLHLDESGDFAVPGETVLIAGLMLQEAASGAADEMLGAALRRLDPLVPYPPHATELRQTAWWIARWALADSAVRAAHPARLVLDRAAAALQRALPDRSLARMADALRQGQMPDYDALKSASRWLRAASPMIYAELEALARGAEDRYRALGVQLRAVYGDARCHILAAVDGGGPAVDGTDRYLSLLTALFERVFALLRANPAQAHEVRVVAAQRHVTDARLPRRRMLMPQDLGACVRRAEAFPLLAPVPPPDGNVRILPWGAVAYREQVAPGVALADFVANRLRGVITRSDQWDGVSAEATAATGLSVMVPPRVNPGSGAQPTIAAAGPARDAIAEAFRGRSAASDALRGRSWEVDQAQRWIAVAHAVRGAQ